MEDLLNNYKIFNFNTNTVSTGKLDNGMAKLLIRSYDNCLGYIEVDSPLEKIDCYVPWALENISKRVVYARIEEARGLPNNHLLTPYKTEISQNRRKLCDTKLGLIALTNPSFSNEAIKCVSAGILQFLNNKKQIH